MIYKLTILSLMSSMLFNAWGWSDEIAAPENFEESYGKLHECKPSEHPAADYILTWLSPDALPVWDELSQGNQEVDFPKGAVVVKSQYKNDKCTQLTGYTIMEKTSTAEGAKDGGWKWQFVDETGSCNDCDAGASCAGCHQSCEVGPTHFCTEYQ